MKNKLPKSTINDPSTLRLIKDICFTERDVRAGWIGPGIPETSDNELIPIAKWAMEHWNMYASFLSTEMMKSSGCILDVGCGVGYATINLATIMPQYTYMAIDLDRQAVRFANRYNNKKNIQYIKKNLFHLTSNAKFNYIFALEIYEHIPPLMHNLFIDKCLSLLAPGGKLFFTTPNELDQKDAEYGHIGFLNRSRAKKFITRYKQAIIAESFINNKRLLTSDKNKYITQEPIISYESNAEKKSHFRLILSNQFITKSQIKFSFFFKIKYIFFNTTIVIRNYLKKIYILCKVILAKFLKGT